MKHLRALLVAVLSLLCLPAGPAAAASGYDMSDLWWNPAESGWGIQFVQQRDVIFATLYVYDASGAPVWYVATTRLHGPDTPDPRGQLSR